MSSENTMKISNILNPDDNLNQLTAHFETFGLKLAEARSSDSGDVSNPINSRLTLPTASIFSSPIPAVANNISPAPGSQPPPADKCDIILKELNAGRGTQKPKTWDQLSRAKKAAYSTKIFEEEAERAQYPELAPKIAEEEENKHQWIHPGPYIPPKFNVNNVHKEVKRQTINRMKLEIRCYRLLGDMFSKTPLVNLQQMIEEEDWEHEQATFDVYGDLNIDWSVTPAPFQKYKRAGQRNFKLRKINKLLDDLSLEDGGRSKSLKVKTERKRDHRFAPY